MKLDLTGLSKIATNPAVSPSEGQTTNGYGKGHKNKTSPSEGEIEAINAINQIQRGIDIGKGVEEHAKEIYKRYQTCIKETAKIQKEIAAGVRSGDDPLLLFLKACEALSMTIANRGFYNQIVEDVKAVYGYGLNNRTALEIELTEIKDRIERLRKAEQRAADETSRRRLISAIAEHIGKQMRLEKMIEGGGD